MIQDLNKICIIYDVGIRYCDAKTPDTYLMLLYVEILTYNPFKRRIQSVLSPLRVRKVCKNVGIGEKGALRPRARDTVSIGRRLWSCSNTSIF